MKHTRKTTLAPIAADPDPEVSVSALFVVTIQGTTLNLSRREVEYLKDALEFALFPIVF